MANRTHLCLLLCILILMMPAASWAKMGAIPGPAIISGHILAQRYGCPLQPCPITVGVGEMVYFSAEGYEDIDYYYDPVPVIDRCRLENWQFEGARGCGAAVIWEHPGTYQVSCQVVDAADWADDLDHPTMTATVNVVQSVRITDVYSTDGTNKSSAGGGAIGIDVEWSGDGQPELVIAETQGLHAPEEGDWGFVRETTQPCSYLRKGSYIWNTPMHGPGEYHNAPWSIAAQLTYNAVEGPPEISRDETTVTLKNLLVENVTPDLLKQDPEDPMKCARTVTGQISDDYTLNPDAAHTDLDIYIYAVGEFMYPGTLAHHATVHLDGPGGFTYDWDGTMSPYGGITAPKGLYAADVYANQAYPGGSCYYHYDSHSFRSGDISIGPVSLEFGDYDKQTHSRPFRLTYFLMAGSGIPPEWVKVDLYDPDLGTYRNWSGGTSLTQVNEITGDLPLHKDGMWTFVITALDQDQAHEKAHNQSLALPVGTTYTRAKPVVRLTSPDPSKNPHTSPYVDPNYGNEFSYSQTQPLVFEGSVTVPAAALVLNPEDDASEPAWEVDWLLSRPLTNTPTRLWPNGTEVTANGSEVFMRQQGTYPDEWVRGFFSPSMPASNDEFGDRVVTLCPGGWVQLDVDSPTQAEIQLFFSPLEHTHPVGGPDACVIDLVEGVEVSCHESSAGAANWLYYWSQVDPQPVDVHWAHSYVGPDTQLFGLYLKGSDHVHVFDDVVTKVNENGMFEQDPVTHDMEYRGYERSQGIDCFARVVAHEWTHKLIYETWPNPANDYDHDGLPEDYELSMGLDPQMKVSVPYSEAAGWDDQELICHRSMKDKFGSAAQDWSAGGWMYQRMPEPPLPSTRVQSFPSGP